MLSMFDYMKESSVEEDGEFYPDVWSVNWSKKIEPTSLPGEYDFKSIDLAKFWATMYQLYGTCDLIDLLLYLNNVEYITDLVPGEDILYLPSSKDLAEYGDKLNEVT